MLVYRENTEGEYAPVGGNLYPATEHEIAVQTGVFTRRGCDRILRAAFDYAVAGLHFAAGWVAQLFRRSGRRHRQ